MLPALWLWLAASATRVELVDEVFRIPASDWRYFGVAIKQHPVRVSANFEVQSGDGAVRIALLRDDDLDSLREGRPHGVVATTELSSAGTLLHQVRTPGQYSIVIDNTGKIPAKVHLRVALDFSEKSGPQVGYLPRERQLAVIALSFAIFFGIVFFSGRRLLRATRL